VLLRLLARRSHSSLAAGLLVRNKEGDGLSTFVDMGVYTRNRWVAVTHSVVLQHCVTLAVMTRLSTWECTHATGGRM
jgi:hypothetical protein